MRNTAKMSYAELASRLGVTENTVRRYESGFIRTIPDDQKLAMAKLFGCAVPFLMGWPEEPNGNDNGEQAA
jgi:transcriptional regulator with XRE-family HTH domain